MKNKKTNAGTGNDVKETVNKVNTNFIGVSLAMFISKMLGFLRDVLLGASLGTTKIADVFMQIFGIPGLFFASIGVAISSINIPNLIWYAKDSKKSERNEYVSAVLTNVTLVTGILSILIIAASPVLIKIVLPGMEQNMQGIAVALMRTMAPTLIFICLTYITTGILQVHNHFLLPAIISIPFNLLIIASLAVWHSNVLFLGLTTTIAWALQFLIQLPVLKIEKYSLEFNTGLHNSDVKNIYRQLIPILLGNSILQLCIFTDKVFASYLGTGATSALSYGSNLFMMATGIFLVAMSTVIFPELSKSYSEKDNLKIIGLINYIFKVLVYIFVPYLLVVAFFHTDIVRIAYQRGAFNAESTALSSKAFLFYSFCIVGYAFQEIFNRLFYAMGKYRIPMVLGLIYASINMAINLLFKKLGISSKWGISSIAGTTAVIFLVYAISVAYIVRKEFGRLVDRSLAGFILKMAVPVFIMLAVFIGFKSLFASNANISFSRISSGDYGFIISVLSGGILYIFSSWISGAVNAITAKQRI
jgi:putative peptidoglycan lipid II flippase